MLLEALGTQRDNASIHLSSKWHTKNVFGDVLSFNASRSFSEMISPHILKVMFSPQIVKFLTLKNCFSHWRSLGVRLKMNKERISFIYPDFQQIHLECLRCTRHCWTWGVYQPDTQVDCWSWQWTHSLLQSTVAFLVYSPHRSKNNLNRL